MCNGFGRFLLILAIGLPWCRSASSAAPKSADKPTESEKAIKAFVAKVVTAFGQHDLDALVELSDVPFNHQPGGIEKEKAMLRGNFRRGIDGKPKFEGKHEVKRIQTFQEAKPRLGEVALADYSRVLSDDDYVVHVEIQAGSQKLQARLLVKLVDGKPRLVGLGEEDS